MKRLVLNIPDSEYRFFMKVIRNFPLVEVDEKKNQASGTGVCKHIGLRGSSGSRQVNRRNAKQPQTGEDGA